MRFMSRYIVTLLLAAVSLLASFSALAARAFPVDARPGQLQGVEYPLVRIDGKVLQLAPGSVVYDQNNLSVVGAMLPQSAPVYYRLDSQGQVRNIWIMTPEEQANAPRR